MLFVTISGVVICNSFFSFFSPFPIAIYSSFVGERLNVICNSYFPISSFFDNKGRKIVFNFYFMLFTTYATNFLVRLNVYVVCNLYFMLFATCTRNFLVRLNTCNLLCCLQHLLSSTLIYVIYNMQGEEERNEKETMLFATFIFKGSLLCATFIRDPIEMCALQRSGKD